jgi:cellulose synthase/poly-beta-1,6-N-acetylglucosamine synthase-like glycosyltransferase
MREKPKISFLIAAHNEEKIIAKTIENLIKLPYDNYEILLGLDGCTDKTEEIVKRYAKKSRKINFYKLNLREGKPAVIDSIVKHASGEIIIINDADWIFEVKDKGAMRKLVSAFDNKKVGGIAESFAIQYPTKEKGLLEAGVGIQTSMWMNYAKTQAEKLSEDWIVLNKSGFPMLVNIYRKNLYKKNVTLGDDFERFLDITSRNKLVLATNNSDIPRMVSIGENYTIRGIFKQKERTALARKQIGKRIKRKLGVEFVFFALKEFIKLNLKEMLGFFVVNIIFAAATFKSKFKKEISTKEGWKMRLER